MDERRTDGSRRRTQQKRSSQRRTADRRTDYPRQSYSRDEIRSMKTKAREKKRRPKRLILYSLGIIALIAVAIIISVSVFFKIGSFAVTGDEIYSHEEIIAATELKTGDNLFTFSKENISAKVEKALPYVESLGIKRSLTGKVTLNVKAASAALAIDNGDEYVILNSSCKVLEEHAQAIDEKVAVISTSPVVSYESGSVVEFEDPENITVLNGICKILSENGIDRISGIDVTDRLNNKLQFDNRIKLKIGSLSSFRENAAFIKATLDRLSTEDPSFEGVIDFTIQNKAFVNETDDEETTAAPEIQTEEQPAEQTVTAA